MIKKIQFKPIFNEQTKRYDGKTIPTFIQRTQSLKHLSGAIEMCMQNFVLIIGISNSFNWLSIINFKVFSCDNTIEYKLKFEKIRISRIEEKKIISHACRLKEALIRTKTFDRNN